MGPVQDNSSRMVGFLIRLFVPILDNIGLPVLSGHTCTSVSVFNIVPSLADRGAACTLAKASKPKLNLLNRTRNGSPKYV